MAYVLKRTLPSCIIDVVKEYTGEGFWRNGEYINIHRIAKSDPRYQMLKKRPKIKQLKYDTVSSLKTGSVWFKISTGKFIVINVMQGQIFNGTYYSNGDVWEMNYNKKKIIHYLP
jgi:hypothetical protein